MEGGAIEVWSRNDSRSRRGQGRQRAAADRHAREEGSGGAQGRPDGGSQRSGENGSGARAGWEDSEARKIYEDLLAKYPQIYQLEGFVARTYAAENNIPQALEHLKINLEKEKDPAQLTELKLFQ